MFQELLRTGMRQKSTRGMYRDAMATSQKAGGEAEQFYMDRARSFDPYAAAETSAQGQFNSFRKRLERDITGLRETQVGMGRLDSGWAQQGEDELMTDSLDNLNDRIMSNANHAASMDLQNFQNVGNYGLARTGMFYDLLSGELDRQTAERNAKRARTGQIVSGVAGLAGALF